MCRWLGLTVGQAEALPWWEFRMLAEQMLEDKPWITYSVQVEPPEEEEQVGSDLDSIAGLGMTTTTVTPTKAEA